MERLKQSPCLWSPTVLKSVKIWKSPTSWPVLNLEYTTWFLPQFYSLNKLMLVEESQSQSADYSWQIPQKIA